MHWSLQSTVLKQNETSETALGNRNSCPYLSFGTGREQKAARPWHVQAWGQVRLQNSSSSYSGHW